MTAQLSTDQKTLRLSEAISHEIGQRALGHCLRVDHLDLAECERTCLVLRTLVSGEETDAFVLGTRETDLHIPVDRAIELRNRKRKRVCIFVPADLQDVAASSLGNSFSLFPLQTFLRDAVIHMLDALDEERRRLVLMVRNQLRGGAKVPLEREIEYLTAVEQDPSVRSVGANLWRVGLIPDLREDFDAFSRDVELNRICVDRLARPSKPQSGLDERIASLRLKPSTIQTHLQRFLGGFRLTSDSAWLREILREEDLTFDKWSFPELVPSDLEYVAVEPFHESGKLRSGTGLNQDAPGTVPVAPCGAKCKVKLKWLAEPSRPRNVEAWLVEMLPNPEEHPNLDPDATDLPKKRVKGAARSTALSLDIDLDSTEVRSVVVRVTALDPVGVEIRNLETDEPISNVSQPFYLEEREETAPGAAKRLSTDRCLADALLNVALKGRDAELKHTPLEPIERDLLYLPVQINERNVARMATTAFLFDIERECAASPDSPVAFSAAASDIEPLAREDATAEPIDLGGFVADKTWREFGLARKRFFEQVKAQGCKSVCALRFTEEVCEAVIRLSKAYIALCDDVTALAEGDRSTFERGAELLTRMDCVEVTFRGRSGGRVCVHMPYHPARLLWMAAYSEWVEGIAKTVLACPPASRKKLIDPGILRHISPDNVPAWTVRPGEKGVCFAENLHFAYGVSLPTETLDPAALLRETAWTLGFGEPDSRLESFEGPRVAEQVRRYRGLHPYASTLRIATLNAGGGSFLTDALLDASRPIEGEDQTDSPARLDLVHCLRPEDATPRAEAERFLSEWQRSSASVTGDHLRPSVEVCLARLGPDLELPGEDVHLTVMLDGHSPKLVLKQQDREQTDSRLYSSGSIALFGLVTKLEGGFETTDSSAVWWHEISLGSASVGGEHPVRPAYTRLLVASHEASQALAAAVLGSSPERAGSPCLRTEVDAEGLRVVRFFHDKSDWVLSVDRRFGIEFYDSPSDLHLGKNAQSYLLDYVPEFIEGIGYRQIVTTKWSEEITQIMQGAMEQIGLATDPGNCVQLLSVLKTLSGRLALRLATDDSLAQETVGLAIATSYLLAKGDLQNAIVIPVDAHKNLFHEAKKNEQVDTASRCDLLVVRGAKNRLRVEFIEVKSRSGMIAPSTELLDTISEQTHRTEHLFRTVYFADEPRLDAPIQRCRLASVLRFYLQRARRHGRITSEDAFDTLTDAIGRFETGQAKMVSSCRGFIVNLKGVPVLPVNHADTQILVLTGPEVESSTSLTLDGSSAATSPNGTGPSGTGMDEQSGLLQLMTRELPLVEKPEPVPSYGEAQTGYEPDSPGASDAEQSDDSGAVVIDLGVNVNTDKPVRYEGTISGSPHLFILGIPGQGKSWAMQRLVAECAAQNVPSLILDFHGQFSNPSGVVAERANPLILDASAGLPFSPLEASSGGGPSNWKSNAFQVAEIIQHVFALGEMQRDLLYEAIRDAYIASGFQSGSGTPPRMSAVYDQLRKKEEERKGIRNTSARCRPLFEFNLFEDAPDRKITYAEAYSSGMVVDLHSLGLETLQNAAGAFVLRKLYKDMFTWGESERLRLMVVLDEAHRLAKDVTLPKLMKEGRKFGVGVVVASQSAQDFHPEILENAGTKIAFRLNHPQNRQMSSHFKPSAPGQDLAGLLAGLKVGEALVQTPNMASSARVKMKPLSQSATASETGFVV